MIERFRALLDRPLDPRHARAVVLVASCATVAFAILVGLGVITGSRPDPSSPRQARASRPTAPSSLLPVAPPVRPATSPAPPVRGSHGHSDVYVPRGEAAGTGAHGLLGHLPYRRGRVRIELAGRRRGRVVVRVTARTGREARVVWRRFLRRFHDDGRGYRAIFVGRGGDRRAH